MDEVKELHKLEKESIHWVLTHSYVMYLFFLLVGVSLDLIFKLQLFHTGAAKPLGIFVILFATGVIYWIARTEKHHHIHLGLFLLLLGLGLILNAFFVVLTTLISFFVGKFVFHNLK